MSLKTYECTVLFDASAGVTVQAESPEEAAMMAADQVEGHQHLCHQCRDTLDTGDSIGVLVYEGGEMVADTTYSAEALAKVEAQRDELLAALRRLSFAAGARDNTMGDPCRLIEVKAELAAADRHAMAVIAKVTGSPT